MNKKLATENHQVLIKEEGENLTVLVDNVVFSTIPSLSLDELNLQALSDFIEVTYDTWDLKTVFNLDRFDYMIDGSTCANSRS